MTLDHGSNADIDRIDLTRGLRYKDFGIERALCFLHKTSVKSV